MSKEAISSDQEEYHFLFVISSNEGQVEGDKDRTLTLKNLDLKTLYMTARPGRDRAFIPTDRFLMVWMNNLAEFNLNPPQIGLVHSAMEKDTNGISQAAFPIALSNPVRRKSGDWEFKLTYPNSDLKSGLYSGIVLFIDWLPNIECPLPIKLILPTLFN